MADYGEMIEDIDPQKDSIYEMFTDYFNNPTLIKSKDDGNHSMYLCKLYCLLNRECRYIIVFTEKDSSYPGTMEELRNLKWVSLQTRTLPDNYENSVDIVHGYEPKNTGPLMALIEKVSVNEKVSTYHCKELPLVITLLHTKKNTADAYHMTGRIVKALETFQTIITFKN